LDSILVYSEKLQPNHSDVIQYPPVVWVQLENEANDVGCREMKKPLSSAQLRFLPTMSDDFRGFKMDISIIFPMTT
jgi:hypothetical protein